MPRRVVTTVPSPPRTKRRTTRIRQSIDIDMKAKRRFQARLLTWYRRYGRDLPWRKTFDPYKILVSEVMLQQTQVDRVIPKYHEFLERYPSFQHLAEALTEVLADADACRRMGKRVADVVGWVTHARSHHHHHHH